MVFPWAAKRSKSVARNAPSCCSSYHGRRNRSWNARNVGTRCEWRRQPPGRRVSRPRPAVQRGVVQRGVGQRRSGRLRVGLRRPLNPWHRHLPRTISTGQTCPAARPSGGLRLHGIKPPRRLLALLLRDRLRRVHLPARHTPAAPNNPAESIL